MNERRVFGRSSCDTDENLPLFASFTVYLDSSLLESFPIRCKAISPTPLLFFQTQSLRLKRVELTSFLFRPQPRSSTCSPEPPTATSSTDILQLEILGPTTVESLSLTGSSPPSLALLSLTFEPDPLRSLFLRYKRGGKCIEFDSPSPSDPLVSVKTVRLREDQSASDPRVSALLNSWRNRTAIVLVAGNNYQGMPFDLGCGYVVLGW